ncbi:MAG: AAA family ATPase [Micromonosporaceae bacterium]
MSTAADGVRLALQYVRDGYSQIDAAERTGVPLVTLRQAIEAYATAPVTAVTPVSPHLSHPADPPDLRKHRESDRRDGCDSTDRRRTWWNLGDLLAAEFPEPRWAVPDLIPEGVTLLAGQPKIGKSWLSLGLAVAVASGGKALGDIDVEPGGVLYAALEDTPRRLQDRLGRVLGGQQPSPEARRNLEIVTTWDTELVDRWLNETRGKRLLILDVLARVRGPVPAGAQIYDADYRAMSRIKAIADEYEVPALAVHHTRKMASADFLNEVSGSNGLAWPWHPEVAPAQQSDLAPPGRHAGADGSLIWPHLVDRWC